MAEEQHGEALQELAALFIRLPYLRQVSGPAAISAEWVIETLAGRLVCTTKSQWPKFCHGQGKPHIWSIPVHGGRPDFVQCCEKHPERRQKERRRQ